MNERNAGSGAGATFTTQPPQQCQATSLGTRRDHLMGAGGDESREVTASPRGSQQEAQLHWRRGQGLQKPGQGADTACGAALSEQKEKANAGHQLGINQKSSSAVPSSCSRKALATRTKHHLHCRHALPGAAALAPGVRWPWELSSDTGCRRGRAAVPRRQARLPAARSPARLPGTERRNSSGCQLQPIITPLTCLGASTHGNALAPGCQTLESYKWETFGERKKIREPTFN